MTPRREDLQLRKDRILGIAINEYIKTVSPVSSRCIAREHLVDLSPATIRNILAELEIEGYLTHPHTSAGRSRPGRTLPRSVPPPQGFRRECPDNTVAVVRRPSRAARPAPRAFP